MPINIDEYKNGKIHSKLEDEILSFLNERKDRAFTSQEIMEGIRYHTEFSTPEISKMSTFAIADFTAFLHHLVEKGKIGMKIVRGRMYIMTIEARTAKCPKCGETVQSKKTWMMAGRPNKKGERFQLQIGIFECSKHGYFRAVLGRQKIVASKGKVSQTKISKRKKPSSKRRTRRKSKSKKKANKKSKALLLI